MANYFPSTNDNWSNLNNWLTGSGLPAGSLPTIGDNVFSNSKVVIVDVDFNVDSISNSAADNILVGGYFVVSTNRSLTANVIADQGTCLWNNSNINMLLRGFVIGGNSSGSYGILNSGTGTVFVSGTSIGGLGETGIFNGSSGTVYVTRVKGSDSSIVPGGVNNSSFGKFYVEQFEFGAEGASPMAGPVFLTQITNSITIMKTEPLAYNNVVLFNSLSTQGLMPPVSSVRSGTVYGNGEFVGTMIIPPASAVQLGVPLDDEIGTFGFSPELFWNYPRSLVKDPNSIGYRTANLATIASVGQLIGSFNLSPPQSAFNL
jgi:hypothetical protein